MDYLQEQINKLQQKFSPDDLRRMFADRQNDSLFSDIGKQDKQSREAQVGGHLTVWRGFELLTDSIYLHEKQKVDQKGLRPIDEI